MSYLRINDIVFDVPATDISVDHVNMMYEWPPTLRSRHSTKLKSGKGDVLVHVRTQVFASELSDLHRLAVEFKHTPFWQVENQFIRDSIEPHLLPEQRMAFAAIAMNVSSVPGNPLLFTLDLSMKYFNYAPYSSNFGYRNEWKAELSPGNVWTVYDIQLEEADPIYVEDEVTQNSVPAEDRSLDESVPAYPRIKLNGHAVDIGDLNPLPYQTLPTQPVDCHESEIYRLYINKLQWEELNELTWTYLEKPDLNIRPPAYFHHEEGGGVTFRWTEYIYVEANPELARMISQASATTSPQTTTPFNLDAFTPTGQHVFINPVPGGRVTDVYNPARLHPVDKTRVRPHNGTDIAPAIPGTSGDPILAPNNGVIYWTQLDDGNSAGHRLFLRDNDGYVHGFYHVSGFGRDIPFETRRDISIEVQRGQTIAYIGNSGRGTGPHLHWDVWHKDGSGRFNPLGMTTAPGSSDEQALYNDDAAKSAISLTSEQEMEEERIGETKPEDVGNISDFKDDYDEDEIEKILANIESQKEALLREDWQPYRSPHVNKITQNVWWRKRSHTVQPSSTGNDGGILTGVGVALNNRIVSIPLAGHQYPTMQHIGGYDNRLFLTFASITNERDQPGIDPDIKMINAMTSALESNARNFRMIPDSWTVEVETAVTSLAGHKTYVVDRIRNDVGPGNPGLSNLEITLVSSLKKPEEELIKEANIDRAEALQRIVKELLKNVRVVVAEARKEIEPFVPTVRIKRKNINQPVNAPDPELLATGAVVPRVTENPYKEVSTKEWFDQTKYPRDEWTEVKDSVNDISERRKGIGKPAFVGKNPWIAGAALPTFEETLANTDWNSPTDTEIAQAWGGGPAATEVIVDDGIQRSEILQNQQSSLEFKNGKEGSVQTDVGYFVKYENLADPEDKWLYEKVDDLILLMQFASAVLSDRYFGGYKRNELSNVLRMYGMERYVLPSFEGISSSILGFQNGFGGKGQGFMFKVGVVNNVLKGVGLVDLSSAGLIEAHSAQNLRSLTRPLTAGKVALRPESKGVNELLFRTIVLAPLNILVGIPDILMQSGEGDRLNIRIAEALAAEGSELGRTLLARARAEEAAAADTNILDQLFIQEENDIMRRVEDIVDQYFNVAWLSEQGQSEVINGPNDEPRSEFIDIFEKLTTDALTSTSPCYPDLTLPGHPLFQGLDYANLYTTPDFYFYNSATDSEVEENLLDSPIICEQIKTIVENSYMSMKRLESGSLESLGPGRAIDQLGANFDGSDNRAVRDSRSTDGHSPGKGRKNPYGWTTQVRQGKLNSGLEGDDYAAALNREYLELSDQFVTAHGYSEIRNETGLFEKNPTLDHDFGVEALQSMACESLGDLQRHKSVMRRAFPTFKLFFIEDDTEDNNWRALDDFYSYNAIRSIALTRSAKVPADMCIIELQNISGVLDGSLLGGIRDVDYLKIDDDGKLDTTEAKLALRRRPGFEGTDQEDLFDSLVLREGMNIQLRLGYHNNPEFLETAFNGRVVEVAWSDNTDIVRIVCQSYAVELVQVQKGITGKLLSGADAHDNITLSHGMGYANTAELLSILIKSPECLHFGRWQFGVISQDEESSDPSYDPKLYTTQFDLLPDFTTVVGAAAGAWIGLMSPFPGGFATGLTVGALAGSTMSFSGSSSMSSRRWDQLWGSGGSVTGSKFSTNDFNKPYGSSDTVDGIRAWANDLIGEKLGGVDPELKQLGQEGIAIKQFLKLKWRSLKNDPQDDNIFTPHPTDYVDYGLFDYTGKITRNEIIYHVFNTTIWDVFQEMTYRHPGWIASPVPYGDRMTMFFGVPSQRYWSRPASAAFINKVKILRNQIKQAQIDQRIPSAVTLSEYLRAIKLRFRPFRKYHLFTSYTDIVTNNISVSSYGVSNAIAVQYNSKGFFDGVKDFLGIDSDDVKENLSDFPESTDRDTFVLKYHRNMDDEDTYLTTLDFMNCNGKEMALRYALSGLCKSLKEMYKGSLVVLGNSEVKPYDVGILMDIYNAMSGPFEVEEVTHFFSAETGFISVIVPKAFVVANETSSSPLWDAIAWGAIKKAGEYWRGLGKAASYISDLSGGPTAGTLGTVALTRALAGTPAAPVAAAAATGATIGAGIGIGVEALLSGKRYITRDQMPVKNKDGTYSWKPIAAPVMVIPLTMHGRPLTAGLPRGIPETQWEAFKGNLQRTLNSIQNGATQAFIDANTMGFNVTNAYDAKMSLLEKTMIYASN
jgi:hypothetical protein